MVLINCPLLKKEIEEYECYELCMSAEGLAPQRYISNNEIKYNTLKDICLKCKNHRND